jgi:uncharacterized protein (TIGR02147 family)
MIDIHDYFDYKAYLKALIKNSGQRGFIASLADAAGCQRSYFSSMLNGKIQLLPDHLFGLSQFLSLNEKQSEYFFLILDYARASQSEFRRYLLTKIKKRQREWLDIKNRVQHDQAQTDEKRFQIYYSNYLFSAVHIAVSIPGYRSLASLSHLFGQSEKAILEILKKLQELDLVERKGELWQWKSGDLHLPKESPLTHAYQLGWKTQALLDLNQQKEDSVHYVVVQSISFKDFEILQAKITAWIQQLNSITRPSDPEQLICFNVDFFKF